jgi:hypothetical protein
MTMSTEGFSGRLEVDKRKREILPALLKNAPFSEDELHVPLQLQFNEQLPIVISFFEYYRFLDKMVGAVLSASIARMILVRVKMPSAIPLPHSLLDGRVAIFHDIDVESDELRARGIDHLCVDANFKLYSWSDGDNCFTVKWVSPSGNRLRNDVLETIQDVIGTLPATAEYFNDWKVQGQ